MSDSDLEKGLKCFEHLFDKEMSFDYGITKKDVKVYCHKEQDYFAIYVDDDNCVYQAGTEADSVGIELTDYEKLKTRFESFTGEDLENI